MRDTRMFYNCLTHAVPKAFPMEEEVFASLPDFLHKVILLTIL